MEQMQKVHLARSRGSSTTGDVVGMLFYDKGLSYVVFGTIKHVAIRRGARGAVRGLGRAS